MVRMAVDTTVWSRAARNMPSISPDRIVRIWRWVKTPLESGAAAARRSAAAVVRVDWLIGSLSKGRWGRCRRPGGRAGMS
jgi:hypothetical protein